ncbi:MAG TPA: hypothetical protein VJ783_13820 [Pirellulales bacterium]|nr:hypothetical protein [Pirellulales bacterium]
MRKQFILLHNGLRDHRGHYFETSVSVAEAARRAGWHPVLAAHVDCRTELLPSGLEAHSIFRTDHWMDQPPAEDESDTKVAFRSGEGHSFAERKATLGQIRWGLGKAWWAADRATFYLLPPVAYDGGRWLARWCTPRILRRQYRVQVRARLAQAARRLKLLRPSRESDIGHGSPNINRALKTPDRADLVGNALAALQPYGQAHELEYGLIFLDDLERLLNVTGAGAGDHVWLGTAHAREVLAVGLAVRRMGPQSPTFHLEFRHSLFRSEPTPAELEQAPIVRLYRTCFSLYEQHGLSERIKFYTDTAELSRDYQLLTRQPIGVLPIPFRGELISAAERRPGEPLRLAYLGEARDEKGFPLLPGLIDRLFEDYLRSGRARLLIQANVTAPQYNPQSAVALQRIKRYPEQYVELFGLDAPLSPEAYYGLVSQADVVLLPYDRDRYRACSSGTLAEALAGGRPSVVPARSWMSAQMPPGAGETFHDAASLGSAVERLIDNYDDYRSRAAAHAAAWQTTHAPDALVAALCGMAECQRLAAA